MRPAARGSDEVSRRFPGSAGVARHLDQTMPLDTRPDLYPRARALWPRLRRPRDGAARRDPRRLAMLVARRTALPIEAIRMILEPS
jgi:hypothetical protein